MKSVPAVYTLLLFTLLIKARHNVFLDINFHLLNIKTFILQTGGGGKRLYHYLYGR